MNHGEMTVARNMALCSIDFQMKNKIPKLSFHLLKKEKICGDKKYTYKTYGGIIMLLVFIIALLAKAMNINAMPMKEIIKISIAACLVWDLITWIIWEIIASFLLIKHVNNVLKLNKDSVAATGEALKDLDSDSDVFILCNDSIGGEDNIGTLRVGGKLAVFQTEEALRNMLKENDLNHMLDEWQIKKITFGELWDFIELKDIAYCTNTGQCFVLAKND